MQRRCEICKRYYTVTRKNQVTCGRQKCIRENVLRKACNGKKSTGEYKFDKNEGLEVPKPIKKKPTLSSPASKRWASMSWEDLTKELLYYRMSYPESQLMAEKNTLPEDFGKKRKDVRG